MSLTPNFPFLSFKKAEVLSLGVKVNVVDFALESAHPPFTATYFEVLPGCTTPLDFHQVEECWIVIQGSGVLTYENTVKPISEKDILYFSPFKKHQVSNDSGNTLIILSLYW